MKVLIIEDDPSIVETVRLCFELRWPGVEIIDASSGQDGVARAEKEKPDLVVLDIGLPDINGFEVLRQVRVSSVVPVIILTVRDQEVDKVRGLEMGADDYITKPFSHIEFLARVGAVLRRGRMIEPRKEAKSFNSGELSVDFSAREVKLGGTTLKLTPLEYNLLCFLVDNAGQTLSHRQLLEKVWGPENVNDTDYLKVYMQRLRDKLKDSTGSPKYIATEWGVGYRFVKPPEAKAG